MEGRVHNFGPFGPGVVEVLARPPGRSEPFGQVLCLEASQSVASSNFRIHVAYGWPRLDQRATNIEGYGLNLVENRGIVTN